MTADDGAAPGAPAEPGPVRRLTFEYDGDQIRLASEQHVTLIAPPSHPPDAAGAPGTFALVLRDAQNQPVSQYVRPHPVAYDTEVFGNTADQPIHRVPVAQPKGTFVMLVPDAPGARTLEFVTHPLGPVLLGKPTQPPPRFELRPFEGE